MTRFLRALSLALVLAAWGCSKNPSAAKGSQTERDESELRIAAMSPAMSVMIRDLGLEDAIVACHDFDQILGDSVPRAGSELAWDSEALVVSDPTHVMFQRTSAELPGSLRALASERGWTLFERPLDTLDDVAACADDLYYLLKSAPEREPGEYDMGRVLEHTPPSERLARAWRDRGPVSGAAGRVLVLGSVDPIAAMGPGSYHHQLIERMGMTPAITDGAMWIELSAEDVVELNPDTVILVAPRTPTDEDERFGLSETVVGDAAARAMGMIPSLPINAVESGRLGVCTHPLGLLPSTSLAGVADEIDTMLRLWAQ